MFDLSYTLTIVLIGTMVLGAISGMLGVFIVLRRQALIGDALSHAALPGIMIAYLLVGVRSLEVLLIGAFVSASLAMILLNVIKKYTTIKFDASMALILSGFFGFGQMLLSHIQKSGAASQAGLSRFIFGQAATMLRGDVLIILSVAFVVLLLILLFYKELKLYIFDEAFFKALGLNEKLTSTLLTMLVVIVIVIGIRMVGVILMSALIIAPSVASRQLSDRFSVNFMLSGLIGALSAGVGTYLSATRANLPTGPMISVVLGTFVLFVLLASPKHGLIKRHILVYMYKYQIRKYRKLIHLYENPSETELNPTEYSYFIDNNYLKLESGQIMLTHKALKKIRSIKAVD